MNMIKYVEFFSKIHMTVVIYEQWHKKTPNVQTTIGHNFTSICRALFYCGGPLPVY
jgi:hypothetical protein